MAPEVMLKESVNFSSDVYSFAIVLWELCTLQIPLAEFADMEEVERRVAKGNWRPSTTWIPSKTLRGLIKDCWNRDPKARPDFVSIEKTLQKCCNKENQGSEGGKLKRGGEKNGLSRSGSFSELYLEVLRKSSRRAGR
jgi:serine/threonine protein kinase